MLNENRTSSLSRANRGFVCLLSLLGLAVVGDAPRAQQGARVVTTSVDAGTAPVIRAEISALFRRAGSCMDESDTGCARDALDQASRMEPNPWEAAQLAYLRAFVESSSPNEPQAISAYEAALETSELPRAARERILMTLARLHVRRGQPERALEALESASGLAASTEDGWWPNTPRAEWLPILRVAPVYPAHAAAAGLDEGYVLVEFTVTARGTVENARVVESSSAQFEQAAVEAVGKWRYVPRVDEDGRPMAVPGVATVLRFALDEHVGLVPRAAPPPLAAEDAPAAAPGPYDVVSEPAFGSPGHLVFRPADLDAFPDDDSLPVVAWANGGCARISTVFADFLSTVASHGFLVIATAPIEPATRWFATVDDLRAALDWAEAEATRAGSPLNGKIATDRMAAMGQSCGGGLAVGAGTDPRVDTTGVFNSGVFLSAISGASRDTYLDLHGPVLLLNGHELDNAMADSAASFDAIAHVPAFYGARHEGGHFATFLHPGGGEFANVASSWLRFRLKDDTEAAAMFLGADCGLCRNAGWETRVKGLE